MAERSIVAKLAEVWGSIDEVGASLDDAAWDTPTDCPGWTVRDQLSHIVGTESGLLGREAPPAHDGYGPHVRNQIGEFNEHWIGARRDRPGAEVLEELREVTAARLAALRAMDDDDFAADSWTPAGPGTYEGFMQIRVFDCWVHEQDVRRAVGRPGHLSGPVAEAALDQAASGMPYVVGKKAGAPHGATVVFDLHGPTSRSWAVGVEGRAKPLADVPADPTVRLRADFETWMTLACGRRSPAEALAEGRVQLDGDQDLGRRVTEQLGFTI